MSWREDIKELSLTVLINLLINGLTTSAAKIRIIEKELDDQLERLLIEMDELLLKNDETQLFLTKQQRKAGMIDIENQTGENTAESDFEKKILAVNQSAERNNVNPQEKIAISKRLGQIQLERVRIVTIERGKIAALRQINQAKKSIIGGFPDTPSTGSDLKKKLQNLVEELDTILEELDKLIEAAAKAGVIGLIISSILQLIVDIVTEKLYKPLKDSVNALTSLNESIPKTINV